MSQDISYVNILLHGLFFMEFDLVNNNLIVTAPQVDMHSYCCGSNGLLMQVSAPDKQVDIDMTGQSMTGLQAGSINTFTSNPAVPQFSRNDTGLGKMTGAYSLRLKLEYPDDILALRCGLLSDFQTVADSSSDSGKFKSSILKSCGQGNNTNFALVTCLRYRKKTSSGSPPAATYSFYAEHTMVPGPDDMNNSYSQASNLFDKKNFGLRLTKNAPSMTSINPDSHPGFGVSADDEDCLVELLPPKGGASIKAINVANCVQFGINP
jgi:hypothetical protein